MKVIAFAGLPFSGKSEAVKIAKDSDIPVIRMGDAVWDEVKNQGLEINDKNVGTVANKMREQHGMDIWAKRTIEKIKSMDKVDSLVIDGIRNIEEIETFKTELEEDFVLVAVEVPDEIRFKRAMSRGRKDDSMDLEKIKERDKRERNWGIDAVIASADIVISNEGTLEELHDKIRKVLKN